jgi:phospholipid/cholesterol/gamma-HCH transport system ATP-binding protein
MPVPAASGEVVIRVQGLHKQLGGRTIHRGIDLEVRRGELVSVMEVDEALLREGIALKLRMVGLAPADAWKFPFELSGGMAKRAALARALMLEAELLFLDEPTSGLDPAAASEFDTLLGELHAELRFTALMITHDVYSVATLSDRVAVLADGRLATIGTLEDVAGCGQPFVADFFRSRHGENHLRTLPVYRSL